MERLITDAFVDKWGMLFWDCPFCGSWYQSMNEEDLKMRVQHHFQVKHERRWRPWSI